MANLLPCAQEFGRYLVTEILWPPIKRHIDYWWSFGDNIQNLRDETDCLERERRLMDKKIEQALLRAESVTPEFGNWSNKCTQKLEEARRTLLSGEELKPRFIISRYLTGKSAKEAAEGIAKLRSEGNLITISDQAPPPSMGPTRHEPSMEFGSRRHIEEDIMGSLDDHHVRVIAICGGGGVGKTTMVQRIEDLVRKKNLFDEVVHVVVSQKFDLLKIQKEIAGLLGLNLIEDTLDARAHKLHIRLVDSKRKLIVFDDVWKRFDLTDLGVPLENDDSARCKIILTSRVEDACKKMNAGKIIRMEVLTESEAWTLFKKKAGSCVEGSDLRLIAEDVAKECKCLPLALVIVGEALKDRSIHAWRDSLSQLRRSIPTDFPELLEDVYKPLKLSYDYLENKSVKSLFLICCLFPEDYNIPIEILTLYSIGLGMFEDIGNVEEGRSRTHNIVEKLRSRFLLMNGGRKHLKMHDVVRDVAIFIGSKEKHGFLKSMEVSSMRSSSKDSFDNCNWMSIDFSIENAKLPVGSDFPNLCLLIMRDSHSRFGKPSQVLDANVIYFEGMKELNVLSFSKINLGSLPPTLALLKKLTTLYLEESRVEDISVVGELASLEILCIRDCDGIQELSADIGRLDRLRILELFYCQHLKRIAAGVISSLVLLEELKIIGCFNEWEAEGNQSEERNASLSELGFLLKLTCLDIEINYHNLLAQEVCLSQRFVRCRLHCTGAGYSEFDCERFLLFDLPGELAVGNWIHQLVRNTQAMFLKGDGSNSFNLADTESLRELVLKNCSTVKKLANVISCKFHVLEQLHLANLQEFEEIVDGTVPEGSKSFENLGQLFVYDLPKLAHLWKSLNQDVSLGKLNAIRIVRCPNLRYLFSLATGRSLVQLRRLEIAGCKRIEQVLWNEMESNTDTSFPNLEKLSLKQLPNLAAFSQGVETVEFPRLEYLKIKYCPKLRLKIGKWNTQLEVLEISNCGSIEQVLWDESEDEGNSLIIFPELWRLTLIDLPCLTTFYRGVGSIKFPILRKMEIGNLPMLNSLLPMDSHDQHSLHFFCNQKVEIPALRELHIRNLQDSISNIWCRHVPNNLFNNLERLSISDVNGIRNLMSSSVAINLVNLDYLHIARCQEMMEVIEDDKEVFVTSLFPKLHFLRLAELQKLGSFCQWKHAFEFPSLQAVEIIDCPALRTFSLGSLSSPILFSFDINGKRIEMKDLNGGTHDHFTTKGEEGDKNLEYPCEDVIFV